MLVEVVEHIFHTIHEADIPNVAEVKCKQVHVIVCVEDIAIDCQIHISLNRDKTQIDRICWIFVVVDVNPLAGLVDQQVVVVNVNFTRILNLLCRSNGNHFGTNILHF